VPVLFGVLVRRHIPLWVVMGAAASAWGCTCMFNLVAGVANPAISATYGIFASLLFGLGGLVLTRGVRRRGSRARESGINHLDSSTSLNNLTNVQRLLKNARRDNHNS
jgi:hypothetical protein